MRMTRRRAFAGLGATAVAVGGAAAGAQRLPHAWYDELTGACGPSGPSPPRLEGLRVVSGTLHSTSVPEPVDYPATMSLPRPAGWPAPRCGSAAAPPTRSSGADRAFAARLPQVHFVGRTLAA